MHGSSGVRHCDHQTLSALWPVAWHHVVVPVALVVQLVALVVVQLVVLVVVQLVVH